MRIVYLVFFLAPFLTSCGDSLVSVDKFLEIDEIKRGSITYANAESLNAISIWEREIKVSSLLTTLFAERDTVSLQARVFEPKDGKERPAIVYIHGGAFVHGSTGVADPTAKLVGEEFARRGYRVYAMEYRSMNLFAPSFIKAGYTAAQDGKAAIRYLNDHHRELNIDQGNVFLIGYSAGGITALNTAYLDADDAILGQREKLESLYGELGTIENLSGGQPGLAGVISLSGGVLGLDVFDASPIPLCLIHGQKDEIIAPDCQLPFARAANLFDIGLKAMSRSIKDESIRKGVLGARLSEVCGSEAIYDFVQPAGMDAHYHPVAEGGHFMLLSPKGKRTAVTEVVLGVMAKFTFALVD